jgi:hypothetical protein
MVLSQASGNMLLYFSKSCNLKLTITDFHRYIIDSKLFYQSTQDSDLVQRKLWHELHASLIRILQRVWNCVRDVLCNDAPEGHVPEDLDPESDIDTKDILSYSWRALKEARCVAW